MAKYKVLKQFRDIETKEDYESDQEIEMTVKRADKAIKNLKKWDGEFLERIDSKEENPGQEDEFDREATKNKLKEMGVEFNGNAKNEALKELLEEHKSKEEDTKEGQENQEQQEGEQEQKNEGDE